MLYENLYINNSNPGKHREFKIVAIGFLSRYLPFLIKLIFK